LVGSARIINQYDVLHRRVVKEVYSRNSAGTWILRQRRRFTYDGWNLIEERVFNASGALTEQQLYTRGRDLSGSLQGAGGVGGLLLAEEIPVSGSGSPIAHYPGFDGNGNVVLMTTASGAVEGQWRYGAFGRTVSSSAASGSYGARQPWRFSGKYLDGEVETRSGVAYYGFRHYFPELGRWPSRDPIGERGGVNLFGFNYNSPTNDIDVLGREPGKLDPGGYPPPTPAWVPPNDSPPWQPQYPGKYCYKACVNVIMKPVDGFKGECPPAPICGGTSCNDSWELARQFAESSAYQEADRQKGSKCCKPEGMGQLKTYRVDQNVPPEERTPPPFRTIVPPGTEYPKSNVA
jgi:RHS repeat-associated protein